MVHRMPNGFMKRVAWRLPGIHDAVIQRQSYDYLSEEIKPMEGLRGRALEIRERRVGSVVGD